MMLIILFLGAVASPLLPNNQPPPPPKHTTNRLPCLCSCRTPSAGVLAPSFRQWILFVQAFTSCFHTMLTSFYPSSFPVQLPYSSAEVVAGKAAAKAALQRRLGLVEDPSKPVVGFITRLTAQKGIHLIKHAIWRSLDRGAQVSRPTLMKIGNPLSTVQTLCSNNKFIILGFRVLTRHSPDF